MSISGSLSSALSGLTAASRAAEVVSNNVANAQTEGYGKREIELSSRILGGAGAVRPDRAELREPEMDMGQFLDINASYWWFPAASHPLSG